MTQYLTRVELHNEQPGDYTTLHSEMESRGFTRRILLGGVWYHLPNATYLSYSDGDQPFVYQLAFAAVKVVGRSAGIVIVPTIDNGIFGGGLKVV